MPKKVEDQALWARLMRPLAVVFGLAVCVACGLAAWQRNAPLSAPTLYPFSETWYAKSMAATAPTDGVADAQTAIRLAPARAENWMLLAYQYSRTDRGITPRVVAAVRQSYAVSPLAYEVTAYRLTFIFNAWTKMPQDVRELGRIEARQYGTTSKGLAFLVQTVPTIVDPRAHLEFAVMTMIAQTQFYTSILEPRKN